MWSCAGCCGVDEDGAEFRARTFSQDRFAANPLARPQSAIVKAAELVLEAGGFGLVVIDFGEAPRALTHASALRIARAAERSGAAMIALAPWRMCGTFAALSLATTRAGASFSRLAPGHR